MPLLVLGMLSLVGRVLAGLARLDWHMPAVAANAARWHRALMISASLRTVLSLERAVPLGRGRSSGAPAPAVARPLMVPDPTSASLAFVTAFPAIVAAKDPVPDPVTSPVRAIV